MRCMRRGIEMNAVNDLIYANQKQIPGRPFQRRQIVPNADFHHV